MEWIKAKYDRVLLGVFGVIALLTGGLLTMKALGFKSSNFPRRDEPEINMNFGEAGGGKIVDAEKVLAEAVEIKEPERDGRPIELFVSAPMLKKAGSPATFALYGKDAEKLRPPVDNAWLYENDLDIRRKDIVDVDSDSDGFTNGEEFNGKSNPRDPKSTPSPTEKVRYTELVIDPMTLNFSLAMSDTEASIKRTEPAEFRWGKTIKVGEQFGAKKDEEEKRFKLVEIKTVDKGAKEDTAVIEDLLTKTKFDLVRAQPKEFPTKRAKVVSNLQKLDEKVVSIGQEFIFEAAPDQHYILKSVDEGKVELETWTTGEPDKKITITKDISAAP
jgi:hypothetical protein